MPKDFLPYGRQSISESDADVVKKVLLSGWITQGPKIEEFERRLAEYCNARYAVAVSSGTTALHTACLAAGLGKGDEAVTTPLTFLASANCVIYAGAKPVFADIENNTFCIDPREIQKKITKKTRVIIPVDFAGHPADLDSIKTIAKKKRIIVIEDAAHSLGAVYHGKRIGALSDMTTFSFHPVKHVTTGEGGAVLTNNKTFHKKLLLLRNHGMEKNARNFLFPNQGPWYYEMQALGFNYRITDFQCALGIQQLKRLDYFVKKRRALADLYTRLLKDLPCVRAQREEKGIYSSCHLYVINLENKKIRKNVFLHLKRNKIGAQVHYIPVYLHPYYRKNYGCKPGDYPNAEAYYNTAISLPLFPGMRNADVRRVVNTLGEVL